MQKLEKKKNHLKLVYDGLNKHTIIINTQQDIAKSVLKGYQEGNKVFLCFVWSSSASWRLLHIVPHP
jgi:phosphoheptose isomerase